MIRKIKSLRPTYAIIDLNNYFHNINQAKKLSNSDIMLIVKADAYGHGANQLASFAYKNCGVDRFGVATIKEAIELREYLGNSATIQILGYVDNKFFDEVINNNLILTIFDNQIADEYHSYLSNKNLKAPIVIKIETGMNRLGFTDNLLMDEFIFEYKCFEIDQIMSHMPSSDSNIGYSKNQINIFKNYLNKYNLNIKSSMFNSSAICNYENIFDYTRPGIMTYGYVTSEKEVDLKPVMNIYSKIIHVKKIKKGEKISYNRTFTAKNDMIIGVVPIGYADGYMRKFSNQAKMKLNDYFIDVLGTVCMDMCMVDLTDVPERFYKEDIEVLGENITAENWASWGETITYEVLCGISDRIPRIYTS